MLGRKDGSSKGKGGSMHYYNSKENFYGGNGIVGAQIPVGTGLSFALKYRGNPGKNVAVAMYGDGAANQGQLYEAANMAALWKLPMVFLCENNRYSMGTSVERHSAGGHDFHKKVYSVPGIRLNGMCVYNVKSAMEFAKEYAVENGPIMVSIDTYRYHGHSMSDPGITYRNAQEVQEVRKTIDCIKRLQHVILENDFADAETLKLMDKEIKKEVDSDVKRAQQCANVPPEWLTTDIFDKDNLYFIRAPNYENSMFVSKKGIN
jgi:pyruvate dehydrogenase E1 component alpha subunit